MVKDKLSFILGVHCHQPVGNFGWVIEEAFEKSYAPIVQTLHEFPWMKLTAHYSGPLLEWIEQNRPGYFVTVRKLVNDNRLEIVGSGFYEPILTIIPVVDRLEQIERMNLYSEEKLGMRPNGLWLTERIWEPALPRTLKAAGVRFTMTDDSHFIQSGIPAEKIRGYYLTEDEGDVCAVFPIDQNLRYAVPFKEPEKTIEYLRARYEAGDRSCCTLVDDGEKFGLWPGTFKLLYQENWLKRFYELLRDQSDWLEITTPSEYLRTHEAEGLVYLPTASYFEMGLWTLSPDGNHTLETLKKRLEKELGAYTEAYLKGGFFRNFFMRYPESNHMHKRMIEVSRKVHQSALEGLPREAAKRDLFMAQCNCGYWHGIFGGLYMPHLRDAIYEHLIMAERMVDQRPLALESFDFECTGRDLFVLRNRHLAAYISPEEGGTVLELDLIGKAANVVNTLARRHEAYHDVEEPDPNEEHGDGASIHDIKKTLTEEERKLLVRDPYRRTCFRDVFVAEDEELTPEKVQFLTFAESGSLSTARYSGVSIEGADLVGADLVVETELNDGARLRVSKRLSLHREEEALFGTYSLRNSSEKPLAGQLLIQFNLSIPAALGYDQPFAVDGRILEGHRLLTPGSAGNVRSFRLRDPHRRFDLNLEFNQAVTILWHPVETISQSESGFDRNYQASAVWAVVPVELAPGKEKHFSVVLRPSDITG